jgi:hypothetical protein
MAEAIKNPVMKFGSISLKAINWTQNQIVRDGVGVRIKQQYMLISIRKNIPIKVSPHTQRISMPTSFLGRDIYIFFLLLANFYCL